MTPFQNTTNLQSITQHSKQIRVQPRCHLLQMNYKQ
uniref:Uncharacterized protein n=1 Tax=Rhizophora mucronata TaxID=61149 RepID=A0A2P2MZ50_RHIMU